MHLEIEPGPGLQAIESLGRELGQACQSLGLSPEMTGWVAAAALSALSAVVLAGGGQPRLALRRGQSQVNLTLQYLPPPHGQGLTPPGLAAGLFSPPALSVHQGQEQGRAFWTAVWEV
jgi:hypothetical protein